MQHRTNATESMEDDVTKETKAEKEKTSKLYICNICDFMYEKGLFGHVSNIHNDYKICNIQFNDVKSLNKYFFVKNLQSEVCEYYVKTEDNLACHDTTIHHNYHINCKIFKNNNISTEHFMSKHRRPKSLSLLDENPESGLKTFQSHYAPQLL